MGGCADLRFSSMPMGGWGKINKTIIFVTSDKGGFMKPAYL